MNAAFLLLTNTISDFENSFSVLTSAKFFKLFCVATMASGRTFENHSLRLRDMILEWRTVFHANPSAGHSQALQYPIQ